MGKSISVAEAKLAVRFPDDMELDALQWKEWNEKNHTGHHDEELHAPYKMQHPLLHLRLTGHRGQVCVMPDPEKDYGNEKHTEKGKNEMTC